MNHEYFDAIIIGGGPAGLLLAKELSKNHSILLLEKNKIGVSNKNWLTYKDRWEKNGFPKEFIDNSFNKWYVQFKHQQYDNEYVIQDDFVCFDEHKFLKYLGFLASKNDCTIKESEPLISFLRRNNLVYVNKKYKTPLLIDCSGISSLIVKKFKLVKMPIYINCFAYLAKFDKVNNKNFYCFFKNAGERGYSSFGFTKIAPKTAQLQYFKYSNKKLHLPRYKKDMLEAQKKFNIPDHEIGEMKVATYPTGELKKQSLNNIILFGDAGFYSPSTNGMGFNEILRQHKRVARHIKNCLREQTFDEKSLRVPKSISEDINNLFFRFLGLIFNDVPPKEVNGMFDLINQLSVEQKKDIMRNTISDKEAFLLLKEMPKYVDMKEMFSIIEKKNTVYLLKLLLRLDKDIFSEEIYNFLNKKHKISVKDLYN